MITMTTTTTTTTTIMMEVYKAQDELNRQTTTNGPVANLIDGCIKSRTRPVVYRITSGDSRDKSDRRELI